MSEIPQKLAKLMADLHERGTLYNTNKELYTKKNDELNLKLEKLWNGYIRLGIVEETPPETSPLIFHDEFIQQYKTLLQDLNSIIKQLSTGKDIPALRDNGEKVIDKILYLTCYRAMTINATEDQYLSQIESIQNQNKSLLAIFPANPPLSVLETFSIQSIDLGEKHLLLLNKCIGLQSDLDMIYKIREDMFSIAQSLFSL